MTAPDRQYLRLIAIGVATLLLVVAGVLWRRLNPNEQIVPPDPVNPRVVEASIARDEALQLIELRNLSLGYLENEELAVCDPLLEEICTRLPLEPFGPRNLTVARLLALQQTNESADPKAHQTALRAALDAAELLEQAEGETAVLHVLRSRIAGSSSSERQPAFDALERATQLAPDEAWIAYEQFQVGRFINDEAVRRRAEASARAAELQSDNVWLLAELLPVQAKQQDAAIGDNLRRLAEIVAPFATTIEAQMRINPLELLQQAQAAVIAGDWPTVLQRVRVVSNVLRPDALAQADKLRVDRHPLAFVLPDFSPEFATRADLPSPQPPELIPVAFAASSEVAGVGISNVSAIRLADFDLDGRVDLLVMGGDRIAVAGRDDSVDWKIIAETTVPAGLTKFLIADLDDDVDENAMAPLNQSHETVCRHADIDAIAWRAGGLAVLGNRLDAATGARSIETAEQDAAWQSTKNVRAATLADLDHDGDLDLVVLTDAGVSLWSSRGNLTFENISARSVLPADTAGITGVLPVDWDRDLDVDVLLVGDDRLGILENLRHGRLRYRELESTGGPLGTQAWDVADVDNDQTWELISAGEGGLALQHSRIGPDGSLTLDAPQLLSTDPFSDFDMFDYDNDGYLDLIARREEHMSMFRNLGAGNFAEQSDLSAPFPPQTTAVTNGDVDQDGDLDLVVGHHSGVTIIANDGGNANRWIDLAARAQQIKGSQPSASGRINHLGIGSTLVVRSGELDQTRLIRSEMTHFGLGQDDQPDVVRILWTNGVPQNVIRPPANGEVCELQTLKGSCPYLYTWTGERFEFCTDLLWNSPLGLQFGEGIVAPWRAWEYLKIPGERLVAQDGKYRLRITEELWEAAYFDEIRLIVVDHPAEIEIFTNEKVGPAEIAEHKVHTVRRRRMPVAARDQRGRDVLPIVAAEDGNYLRGWDHKVRQGVTEPHYLELDLGDLDGPTRITLFLTGWVYPSDTSINVALSQNPDLESPRPPFLETPDESGNWRQVLPYMGFPGGKTKTIAVDVSSVFAGGDYRLRIGTTMEVYWDAAWLTVDEPPEEFRETELQLMTADLHFRGTSRREWGPDNGPETYHYDDVDTRVPWPPMQGAFTRYGDVAPLLADWDDKLIVMGAGDELSIEFAEPLDPPPVGWIRDFMINNVGWDKDADLNTVYGQSTEPLPFRAMTVYALQDGEERVIGPDEVEYLQTYQTRHENRARFWKELPGLHAE